MKKNVTVAPSAAFEPARAYSLIAAAVLGLTLSACGAKKEDAPEADKAATSAAAAPDAVAGSIKPTLSVNVVNPQTENLIQSLQANGNIAAWQEASVGAEVNGLRIANVLANVGDVVRKGQVLATFASETTQADLLQVQANYDSAKADADRARSIADTGALSKQQLDQYFTQEKVAAAQLKAAQVRIGNTTVRAPDSGIISMRSATVGAVAGAGQELFRMVRQGRLEWRGEVTAKEVGLVRVGSAVELETDSGAKVVGKIRAIAPAADAQTRNILVYADLPSNATLKAGMFAKGNISLGQSDALTVPSTALVVRDGFSYVFVLTDQSKVQQRRVNAGRRVNGQIEIVEGLQAADKVVVQGAGFLNEGDLVQVVQ